MAKKKFGVLVNKSINTIDSWCNKSGYTMTVEGAYSVYVDLKQNETGVKKTIYEILGAALELSMEKLNKLISVLIVRSRVYIFFKRKRSFR